MFAAVVEPTCRALPFSRKGEKAHPPLRVGGKG